MTYLIAHNHTFIIYVSSLYKQKSRCQFMIQIPLVPGHPNLLQSFRLRIGVRPLATVPLWRVRRCGQTGPRLGSSDGFKSAISESSSPKPLKMMLLQLNCRFFELSGILTLLQHDRVCAALLLVHIDTSEYEESLQHCPFSRRC